ncbi:MAG: hypothetical protein V1745_01015 [Patescibacteria group bacterium]
MTRASSSPYASIATVWGSVVTGSLVIALQASQQVPSLLTVVVQRPIAIAVALLAACLCATVVLRRSFADVWADALRALPLATGIGVLVSWIGVWNDGSGAIPTSLADALRFVATASVLPASIGPDAFVRTVLLVSVVSLAVRAWRSRPSHVRPVAVGLVAWIVGASVLLVQTWMAFASAVARDLPLAHAEDAMRALGASHMDAYWSSFQADRFFAGVGRQLETSTLLSSSSLLYLVGILLILLVAFTSSCWSRRDVRRALLGRIFAADTFASVVLLSAVICGVIAGSMAQRRTWTALDAVPFVLLAVVAFAWTARFLLGREIDRLPTDKMSHPERPLASGLVTVEDVRSTIEVLSVVAVVGATLLGWPVLLTVLALTVLGEASSAWMRSPWGRGISYGAFAAFMVAAGGLVSSRTVRFPYLLERFEVTWAVVAASVPILAIAAVVASHAASGWKRFLPFGVVGLVGCVIAAAARLPIALAALALVLLVLYRFRKHQDIWRTYALFGLFAYGWAVTAAALLVMRR